MNVNKLVQCVLYAEESDSHPAFTKEGEGPVEGAKEQNAECKGPSVGMGSSGSLSRLLTFSLSAPRPSVLVTAGGELELPIGVETVLKGEPNGELAGVASKFTLFCSMTSFESVGPGRITS